MKNITVALSTIATSLIYPASALAQTTEQQRTINIDRPRSEGQPIGFSTLGDFIQKTLTLVFIVAVIIVLFMLIWGAYEWITSGGDKEAVGKARNRIVNALIGLAVLAVAFALFQVAGAFLGFNVQHIVIPTPSP